MSKNLKYPLVRKEWPKIRNISPENGDRFMVDPRPVCAREYFTKLVEAKTRAEQLAMERMNRGTEAFNFSTQNRVMAVECIEKLRPFGKSLHEAVDHYVSWLKSEQAKRESLYMRECLEQYDAQRKVDLDRGELAWRTYTEIRNRVKWLKEAMGGLHIAEVTVDTIQTYLDSIPGCARSRNNVRLRISKFFNFCKAKGWTTQNPCESISIRVKRSDTQILTVEQTTRLLNAAQASRFRDPAVPFAAICLFAGLRPGEAEQLDWAQVHFDTQAIEVKAHTSKTRDSRFVKMEPMLLDWLKPYVKPAGRIIGRGFQKKWMAVRKDAGFGTAEDYETWVSDVMRHSYASYWLALHNNRAELAELMGNSVGVVRDHYRRPILKSQAEAFWALKPKS